MKKTLLATLCLMAQPILETYAIDFKYKEVDDFPPLSAFKTTEEFEENIEKYTRYCLDNTFGGTGGIPCYIESKIWDRELNTYYKELYSKLSEPQKIALKSSQRTWLEERDKSNNFTLKIVSMKYAGKQGTMYQLMSAGDASDLFTPIMKQRVLLLKNWLEYLETPADR